MNLFAGLARGIFKNHILTSILFTIGTLFFQGPIAMANTVIHLQASDFVPVTNSQGYTYYYNYQYLVGVMCSRSCGGAFGDSFMSDPETSTGIYSGIFVLINRLGVTNVSFNITGVPADAPKASYVALFSGSYFGLGPFSSSFSYTAPPFDSIGQADVEARMDGSFIMSGLTITTTDNVLNPALLSALEAAGMSITADGLIINTQTGIPITLNGIPLNVNATFCAACAALGQPVNTATGAMWHEMVDFNVAGRTDRTSLMWKRTYHAQALLKDGDFGPGWSDNWETRLLALSSNASTNLMWIDPEGGAWTFTRNSDNSFQNPPGFFGKLTEYSDHYTITQRGNTWSFSRNASIAPIGKLVSFTEPHGESIQLSYDSSGNLYQLRTGLAGSISIVRDSNGHITSLTRVRDGLIYTFTYDASGNLISSSDFDGNTTSYAYTPVTGNLATDGKLSTITDPLKRQITFSYQTDGRALSQTEHGGATRYFKYGQDSGVPSTWVTDINGQTSEFQFDSSYRLIKAIRPDGAVELTQWNSQNLVSQETDAFGYVTTYGYDNNGNLSSIQRPGDHRPTTLVYDPTYGVPTQINPLVGAPTSIEVNPNTGDIVQVTRTGATEALSLELTYDSLGHRLAVNNGLTTYSDQTDSNGLKTFIFDERNPQYLAYDSRGRVLTRTFKAGRVLSYSYDNHDRIVRIDDSTGPSLVLTYDAVGRVLSRTLTDGKTTQTTRYQWDDRDRVVAITDAMGNKTSRQYDYVGINGQKIVIDHPISIVEPMGKTTHFTYDSRNRLISKTDARGGITQFQYDLRGDRAALIDALGQKTTFTYDKKRRLKTEDRPTAVRTLSGKITSSLEHIDSIYDAVGKLVAQVRSLASAQNAVSEQTVYNYDDFDRLSEKALYRIDSSGNLELQDDSTYTYQPELDAVRLASASNAQEQLTFNTDLAPPFAITHYGVHATDTRNPLGLIEGEYDVSRDATGEVASVYDASTRHIIEQAKHDQTGRLIAAYSGDIVRELFSSSIVYDSFGRKSKISDSTGLHGTFSYDLLSRPTAINWSNRNFMFGSDISEELTYDPSGNVLTEQRELGTLKYGYDATNELIHTELDFNFRPLQESETKSLSAIFGGAPSEPSNSVHLRIPARDMNYDLVGNRVKDTNRGPAQFVADQIVNDQTTSYATDADGFGRVVAEKNDLQRGLKEYAYRADGKLTLFYDDTIEEGQTVRYFYDPLGRRIAKKFESGKKAYTHVYSYYLNEDKILLAKNAAGKIWLYLDGHGIDEHLGQVGPSGAIGYATNHLGSVLNGAAAGVIHSFGPFGETSSYGLLNEGHACDYADWEPVLYGFTGRQYDAESGKYYFRARMYDPNNGRFMSKDPIGLGAGDVNLYRYANNRPLTLEDPSGKCSAGQVLLLGVVLYGGYIVYKYYIAPTMDQVQTPDNNDPQSEPSPSPNPSDQPTQTPSNSNAPENQGGSEDTSNPNSAYYQPPISGDPSGPVGDFNPVAGDAAA